MSSSSPIESGQGPQERTARPVSNLTAIFFAIAGFTFWVFGDSSIKWIGRYGLPPEEVVAFMGLFMALTLFVQAAVRGRLDQLRPRSLTRQGLRALLDLGNNVCVVVALQHLPLTIFYILVFLSPIATALLSASTLGERITARKAGALLLGFTGVVIAVEPWSHTTRIDLVGVLCCMVCVACFSTNMVWSRVLTRTEPPESLAFCSGLLTAATGLAFTCFQARPLTATSGLMLAMMGIFCAAGTSCFYFAVKHTTAGNVSQYHYTQLVTGAIVSYAVWRDVPSPAMYLGGALILGSGAWIALAARATPTPKTA